ncbi:MAG: tetraacyldisaccharide 4'-kinase [Flavobacteriaceae bacterium]|jgi:tetraacyldisaccharide 4'-kinase
MKLLRKFLFFISPLYYIVSFIRNLLYETSLFKSTKFNLPVIGIGNLAIGGTGKSPMIEYLIHLLSQEFNIATLSRGYGRKTNTFKIATKDSTHFDIGDEPLQFYNKHDNIIVSVDNNRVNGIQSLLQISNPPDVILLDDSYQHRKLIPGLSILLSDYNNLYYDDYILPFGDLREPRSSSNRADIVIVTKCPNNLSSSKKLEIKSKLQLKVSQKLFFSSINYSETVIIGNKKVEFINFITQKFTLVTGLANSNHLVNYLSENKCDFNHLKFKDHYNYKPKDLDNVDRNVNILTTEKDYAKLIEVFPEMNVYYLPIKVGIEYKQEFDKIILSYCR